MVEQYTKAAIRKVTQPSTLSISLYCFIYFFLNILINNLKSVIKAFRTPAPSLRGRAGGEAIQYPCKITKYSVEKRMKYEKNTN